MSEISSLLSVLQDPEKLAKKLEELQQSEASLRDMFRRLNDEREAFKKYKVETEQNLGAKASTIEQSRVAVAIQEEKVARASESLSTRKREFDDKQEKKGKELDRRIELVEGIEKEAKELIEKERKELDERGAALKNRERELSVRERDVKQRADIVADREKKLESRLIKLKEAIEWQPE